MGERTSEQFDPQAVNLQQGNVLDNSEYWVRAQNPGTGTSFHDRIRDRLAGGQTQPEVINVNRPAITDQVAIGDPVVNGKLTLRYGEPDFDRKLAANPNYQQLSIQGIPEGVKVKHFVDAKGYYFWLDGSGEMEQIRGGTPRKE